MILLFSSLFILDNICRAVTTTSGKLLHMWHYSICPSSSFYPQRSWCAGALCHLVIGLLYQLNGQSSVFVAELHLYYVFELLQMIVLSVSGCQQHNG